jgi:hypothetical protein
VNQFRPTDLEVESLLKQSGHVDTNGGRSHEDAGDGLLTMIDGIGLQWPTQICMNGAFEYCRLAEDE